MEQTSRGNGRVFCIIGFVIFILLVSFAFFWYGNTIYGIVFVSVAIFTVLCCYLASQKDEDQFEHDSRLFDTDGNRQRPLQDRPPSYRLTWRRSFMKRFRPRNRESCESRDIEMDPTRETREAGDGAEFVDTAGPSQKEEKDDKINVERQSSLPTYQEAIKLSSQEQLNEC